MKVIWINYRLITVTDTVLKGFGIRKVIISNINEHFLVRINRRVLAKKVARLKKKSLNWYWSLSFVAACSLSLSLRVYLSNRKTMCMCEIGMAAALGSHPCCECAGMGARQKPKFCSLRVGMQQKACGVMSKCLDWACDVVRTFVWPENDGHQSRPARFPKQIGRYFLGSCDLRVFKCSFAQIVYSSSLSAKPAWDVGSCHRDCIRTGRGTRSLRPHGATLKEVTARSCLGHLKKATARFFLLVWLERGPKRQAMARNWCVNFSAFSAPQFPSFDTCNCLLEGLRFGVGIPSERVPWVET